MEVRENKEFPYLSTTTLLVTMEAAVSLPAMALS
jgi:hypothetical protein